MKRIFVLLLTLGIFCACTKEDTSDADARLNGQWNLVFVSCECQPVDLEPGQHIWTFNIAANTLNVINNVTEDLHTILDTGTYTINTTSNIVSIQSVNYDYYFEDTTLYLADNPESDGPLITFVRD